MSYFGEFRKSWRFLSAAGFGLAAGYSITHYVANLMTPHLIENFGWTRSALALIGTTAVLAVLCQPIAGRLTDAFGVRRMATVGVVFAPLVFIGMSLMSGPIAQYFALSVIQVVIIGGTTSATIYSRLVAHNFDRARGVALAIATCTPAALGAISVPFISVVIDNHGWRAGYIAVAAMVAVVGLTALALIPKNADAHVVKRAAEPASGTSYREIFGTPAFRLIILGMLLTNLAFTLQTSQLKVLLLDKGVDSDAGSMAISLFASGVFLGRLLCGAALDRFPTYVVAAISMGLPSVGLLLLATDISSILVIASAVVVLGLCIGAEGDVLAYVVVKYFRVEIYSTVLGLVLGSIALSITLGSLLLSYILKTSGTFVPFLVICSVSTLVGAIMFYQLKRVPVFR
ncbi:MFS transporter [Luteimonas sp. BDR2-5]|uniref:MFS transporter n=1 Tax=Proluteimonas luteida TaxID=2878685 RepID=UPI001E2F6363|nr:MFS transporter [Luteimonas sp. BDR2-5]